MDDFVQLCRWAAGEPVHDMERNGCVPDFSCCRPELLVPLEVRELYVQWYLKQSDDDPDVAAEAQARVESMQVNFVGRLLKSPHPPGG